MPYRGLERPAPACYRHDAAGASETCANCLQAICDICVGFENTQPHCPPCAKKARARRELTRAASIGLGLAMLSALMGGMGWLAEHQKAFDYGIYVGDVRTLEARLWDEPCDRAAALKLSETLLRAGDFRGSLNRTQAFFQRCG